jgi:hypothetical protein
MCSCATYCLAHQQAIFLVTMIGKNVSFGDAKGTRFGHRVTADLPEIRGCEPLQPGELVTTGTLTEAMPAVAGESGTTKLAGIDLAGLRLRLR